MHISSYQIFNTIYIQYKILLDMLFLKKHPYITMPIFLIPSLKSIHILFILNPAQFSVWLQQKVFQFQIFIGKLYALCLSFCLPYSMKLAQQSMPVDNTMVVTPLVGIVVYVCRQYDGSFVVKESQVSLNICKVLYKIDTLQPGYLIIFTRYNYS